MKKLFSRLFYVVLSVIFLAGFQACQSDFPDSQTTQESIDVPFDGIVEFSPSQLDQMEEYLANNGIVLDTDTSEFRTKGIITNDLTVTALKVSCKYPDPSGQSGFVDMSGVILVPKKTIFTGLVNHRLIIATPPTYTSNEVAPSNMFKRVSLLTEDMDLNFLYFWTLQARSGYVVLIPDYLGFGDSYGQCFHPYIESKPMVKSVLELTKTAQSMLSANGYRYKKEIIVTGYSQGGFMAASIARELETSSDYNIPVNLLVTGGTPCYLNQIADGVRASDEVDITYLLPYALWGYKMNGYPQLDPADILKEPYASESLQYFDGTYKNVNDKFPVKVRDLYTDKFLDFIDVDPSMAYIRDILDENSVKPWKNKCKFVMTHGVGDVSVYYQNAADFASDHKKAGGKVTFHSTIGDHLLAVVPYYVWASTYISLYR